MRKRAFALLLCLPAAASAELKTRFDGYSVTQFPPSQTIQKEIGLCHDFAAIALIEAAVARGPSHKRVDLSEADLFFRSQVLENVRYEKGPDVVVVEGGFLKDDVDFALTHGVLSEASYPFDSFLPLWSSYKKTLEDLSRNWIPWDARWTTNDSSYLLEHFKQEDRTGALARERAGHKALFRDIRFSVMTYNQEPPPSLLDPGARELCRAEGASRAQTIIDALEKNHPIGIAFTVSGMTEYGGLPPGAWHGVAVTGYRVERSAGPAAPYGPGVYFLTRDAITAPLHESALCRITQIVALYNLGFEKPPF